MGKQINPCLVPTLSSRAEPQCMCSQYQYRDQISLFCPLIALDQSLMSSDEILMNVRMWLIGFFCHWTMLPNICCFAGRTQFSIFFCYGASRQDNIQREYRDNYWYSRQNGGVTGLLCLKHSWMGIYLQITSTSES